MKLLQRLREWWRRDEERVRAEVEYDRAMIQGIRPGSPPRYNGGQRCDVERGPCACGAWHDEEPEA